MWHDSVCNTVQEPTVTSTIVVKKTTTWGESGFPSEFLDAKFADLVGMRAGEAKARELAVTLKGMDTVSNVAEIVRQLELPAAKIEDF